MQFEFVRPDSGNELIALACTVIAKDDGRDITTPYDDCVLAIRSIPQLRPDATTVRLGRRVFSNLAQVDLRFLRGRPASALSYSQLGSKRNSLATIPICQGITR
jgi:hypothetical protein